MQEMQRKMAFAAIVPLSGLKRNGLEQMPALLAQHLPLSPPHYPLEQVTDRSEQFQATEIIREKLTLRLNQELPYGITVQIERFEPQEDGRLLISAVIWVERPGQKAIIIGQGGERLKEVGRTARLELKHLFGKSVHLELWVKVKENWSDSEAALRQLGFE
jgi:GTP-binding protein Era